MVELDFAKLNGLVPAVIQDWKTGEVLMVGFLNAESWDKTQKEGVVTYFSRTKNVLWRKGETSGNIQKVRDIFVDCDRDTVLIIVEQAGGAACHTGHRSCFYRKIEGEELVESGERIFEPDDVYGK